MRIEFETFKNDSNYESQRSEFTVAVMSLDYKKSELDKNIFLSFLERAENLAKTVNPHSANNPTTIRTQFNLVVNNFIGMISEYAWKYFINLTAIDTVVTETEMKDIANQIDLFQTKTSKTIEVRSSFVTNGISFAIFNQKGFDIIGPYINNIYKHGEAEKDFYLRTLFHYDNKRIQNFFEYFKNNILNIYLVGGATKEMMLDENLFIKKHMKAGEIIGNRNGINATTYKVIPIIKAKDAIQIKECIVG